VSILNVKYLDRETFLLYFYYPAKITIDYQYYFLICLYPQVAAIDFKIIIHVIVIATAMQIIDEIRNYIFLF